SQAGSVERLPTAARLHSRPAPRRRAVAGVGGHARSSSTRLCQIDDLSATRNFQPSVPRPGIGSMLSAAQIADSAASEWSAAGRPDTASRRRSAPDASASPDRSPWKTAATAPAGNAQSHVAVAETAYVNGESTTPPSRTAGTSNASAAHQNNRKPKATFAAAPPSAMTAVDT